MPTTFTVFVCSTFSDLSKEREAVLDSIRRLKLSYEAMEFFGARSERAIETCLEEVRSSDIVIVIVGHTYGSLVPGSEISYSESEYQEARRSNKQCLVYLRDDDVPIPAKHTERDPEKLRLLQKWKEALESTHMPLRFKDGEGLAAQVGRDIERTIKHLQKAREYRDPGVDTLIADITGQLSQALARGVESATLTAEIHKVLSHLIAATEQSRRFFAYLSYAPSDSTVVDQIADKLQQSGIRTFPLGRKRLSGLGLSELERYRRELAALAAKCDVFIFFISPASVASELSSTELDRALLNRARSRDNARIIPVLLADADVAPLLRDVHWVDMRDGNVAEGTTKVLSAIRDHRADNTDDGR
jgi:hypothetical protein